MDATVLVGANSSKADIQRFERTPVQIIGPKGELNDEVRWALYEKCPEVTWLYPHSTFLQNVKGIAEAVIAHPEYFTDLSDKPPNALESCIAHAKKIISDIDEGIPLCAITPYKYDHDGIPHHALRFRILTNNTSQIEMVERPAILMLIKEWDKVKAMFTDKGKVKILTELAAQGKGWDLLAVTLGYLTHRISKEEVEKIAKKRNITRDYCDFLFTQMDRVKTEKNIPRIVREFARSCNKNSVPELARYIRYDLPFTSGIDFGSVIRDKLKESNVRAVAGADLSNEYDLYGDLMFYKPIDIFHTELSRTVFEKNIFLTGDVRNICHNILSFIDYGYDRLVYERDAEQNGDSESKRRKPQVVA